MSDDRMIVVGRPKTLFFEYRQLPQSVNALYIVKGRKKILSPAGRRYRNEFLSRRGDIPVATLMQFEPLPDSPYELTLWFYMHPERLLNLTYGTDKRVKSPYADIDTSNMIKLGEDCIARLLGLRDRNNFSVHAHKRQTHKEERMQVLLRPLETSILEEDDGP